MVSNPVIEAPKFRRVTKSYADKPIPQSMVQTILNIQPWKFTIVTNKAEIKPLSYTSKQSTLAIGSYWMGGAIAYTNIFNGKAGRPPQIRKQTD